MKDFSNIPKYTLLPKEEMLEKKLRKSQLSISLPKETDINEKRIALTPLAVSYLVSAGHKVIIEKNAGLGANYTDKEYFGETNRNFLNLNDIEDGIMRKDTTTAKPTE